eukprot:403368240
MSIEDLTSINFDKLISFNYNPLSNTLEHIVKLLELHHSMFKRLEDNSSIFYSTDSEEEEKKKVQQSKHEKQILDPIYKRIGQLEKMITDQNKELSQMSRTNRNGIFGMPSPSGQGKMEPRKNIGSQIRFKTDDDFDQLFKSRDNLFQKQETVVGGSNTKLGLDKIKEEDDVYAGDELSGLDIAQAEAMEKRMQKFLYGMRREMSDAFSKRIDEMDHKFSVEIAKLTNIIDTELGLQDENDIIEDEDQSPSSISSPANSKIESYRNILSGNDNNLQIGTQDSQHPNNLTVQIDGQSNPNGQNDLIGGQGSLQNHLNAQTLQVQTQSFPNDKTTVQKKNLGQLQRANMTQKTLNELERKFEVVHKMSSKFNDYYDSNHLRIHSIAEFVQRIENLEKLLESKANSLDVKKLIPVINELSEKQGLRDNSSMSYDKMIQQLENSFNNTQKQNNYKLQIAEQRHDALQKEIVDIKKDVEIKFGSKNLLNFGMTNGEMSPKKVVKDHVKQFIQEKMNKLLELIELQSAHNQKEFKKIEDVLEEKVTQKQLEDTHDKFSILLEKFMQKATKQFMDKQETKKTFKMFEKQLKNIFDIIVSKFEEQNLEDAMLVKKPLGGWSCISCQKNVTNMAGAIAEYQVQGKFPWRDPQDRLSKVGAGFSKMLSNLRPETTNDQRSSKFNLGHSISQQNLRSSIGTAHTSILSPSLNMNSDLAPIRTFKNKKEMNVQEEFSTDQNDKKSLSSVKYQPPNKFSQTQSQFSTTLADNKSTSRQIPKLTQLDPLWSTSNMTEQTTPMIPSLKNLPLSK